MYWNVATLQHCSLSLSYIDAIISTTERLLSFCGSCSLGREREVPITYWRTGPAKTKLFLYLILVFFCKKDLCSEKSRSGVGGWDLVRLPKPHFSTCSCSGTWQSGIWRGRAWRGGTWRGRTWTGRTWRGRTVLCKPEMAQRAPALGATKNVTIFVLCKSQFRKIAVNFDFEDSHKALVTRTLREVMKLEKIKFQELYSNLDLYKSLQNMIITIYQIGW